MSTALSETKYEEESVVTGKTTDGVSTKVGSEVGITSASAGRTGLTIVKRDRLHLFLDRFEILEARRKVR